MKINFLKKKKNISDSSKEKLSKSHSELIFERNEVKDFEQAEDNENYDYLGPSIRIIPGVGDIHTC